MITIIIMIFLLLVFIPFLVHCLNSKDNYPNQLGIRRCRIRRYIRYLRHNVKYLVKQKKDIFEKVIERTSNIRVIQRYITANLFTPSALVDIPSPLFMPRNFFALFYVLGLYVTIKIKRAKCLVCFITILLIFLVILLFPN